jgi:hypothetical protein
MFSSLDARIVATNYANWQLTQGKKTFYLPKLPHMAKMYSQLPNLGQMANWYSIILGHTIVCATNMQLVVYKMDTCHKNPDLS